MNTQMVGYIAMTIYVVGAVMVAVMLFKEKQTRTNLVEAMEHLNKLDDKAYNEGVKIIFFLILFIALSWLMVILLWMSKQLHGAVHHH